jgi:hypothetical protein
MSVNNIRPADGEFICVDPAAGRPNSPVDDRAAAPPPEAPSPGQNMPPPGEDVSSPPYSAPPSSGQFQANDFAGQVGDIVSSMMGEATALLNNAKNPDGTINVANQLRAQQMMADAKNLFEMVSKLLSMLSEMQKTALQNMR